MSFAAAVMKAVNSPLYGLKGRVQSVQQAVTYLGVREISAIAYETGLQAAFPQVPQLVAVWERASMRGLLMGRLAQALSMEAWSAHTAGLFEECGKAVLYRHAPRRYAPMLAAARDDVHLVELERAAFGCGHDDVGANLCEAWGLTPGGRGQRAPPHQHPHDDAAAARLAPLHLRAVRPRPHASSTSRTQLDDVAMKLAPQAMLDQSSLLRGLHRVKDKIDEALANGLNAAAAAAPGAVTATRRFSASSAARAAARPRARRAPRPAMRRRRSRPRRAAA